MLLALTVAVAFAAVAADQRLKLLASRRREATALRLLRACRARFERAVAEAGAVPDTLCELLKRRAG